MSCKFCGEMPCSVNQLCNFNYTITEDFPKYEAINTEIKPVAFMAPNSTYRYLNPSQDKVAVFSVKEAEIALYYSALNLQVWAIDEKTMRANIIKNVFEAINFYEESKNV